MTVLGPGGVGKTRLATEAAVISQDEFTAGSWFIDLSPVDDAALVLPAIASGIGLQPGTSELSPLLASRIGAGKSLIVLDTFEHLLPAGPAIAGLAVGCPGLTVLVTSRSALNVRGQREVPLQPLPVRTTASGENCPPRTRLKGLWGAGWLAYHQGDYRQTGQLGRQMLQLLDSQEDQLHRRNALTLIGNAALAEGRTDDAIAALSQAPGLCEGPGAAWHLATSLLNLGTAQLRVRRTAEAKELFARALSIYAALGDQHFTARILIQLGYAALTDDQPDQAAGPIRHAMQVSAQIADAWSIAEGLQAVANLRSHDVPETAVTLAGAADRLREQISMRPHPADDIINRYYLKLALRRIGRDRFETAWAEGREASAESMVAVALAGAGADED